MNIKGDATILAQINFDGHLSFFVLKKKIFHRFKNKTYIQKIDSKNN